MLGSIIGDIVGSVFEFIISKSRGFHFSMKTRIILMTAC